jgi:hypothetical protein
VAQEVVHLPLHSVAKVPQQKIAKLDLTKTTNNNNNNNNKRK